MVQLHRHFIVNTRKTGTLAAGTPGCGRNPTMTHTTEHDRLDENEVALIAAWRRAKQDPDALAALQAWLTQQAPWRDAPPAAPPGFGRDARGTLGFAVLAAAAIQLPALFGLSPDRADAFYARNLGLFVLPVLAAFLMWRRGGPATSIASLAAMFLGAAIAANLPPFVRDGDFVALTALHLPIALWLAVGIAHAGGHWREISARMDFVRFSGELFILYVLIALGGMVFTALMMGLFQAIGIDLQDFFGRWLLPCGMVGAVIVAAGLVDARHGGIGRLAPVLARVFTPLFALLLLAFLAAKIASGHALRFDRDLIVVVDVLLLVVLGLVLYMLSSRAPGAPVGLFERLQLLLVASALLVDLLVLAVLLLRISEFGLTPNRVAALGLNLVLLANLSGSAWLYLRALREPVALAALERWQMRYLPVYAAWSATVVVVLPLVFPRG